MLFQDCKNNSNALEKEERRTFLKKSGFHGLEIRVVACTARQCLSVRQVTLIYRRL